jgi:hypothetical protein
VDINVIAMLTYNDKTVENAINIFTLNKHAQTNYWGFKDLGINLNESKKLLAYMKDEGKTTFLEPLHEDEENCMISAKLAVECGFDYVLGMVYNPRVHKMLSDNGVQYWPTCGRREGLPRMLYGTIEEIVSDAGRLLELEVDGICLSSFRYVDGNPEEMSINFRKLISAPLIISGGINDYHRLDFVKKMNLWGFTIGSALFSHKFGKEKTIADQLDIIKEYIDR